VKPGMWAADAFDDVDGDNAIVVGTVAPASARRAAAAEATGDPVDHVGSPNSGARTPTGGGHGRITFYPPPSADPRQWVD